MELAGNGCFPGLLAVLAQIPATSSSFLGNQLLNERLTDCCHLQKVLRHFVEKRVLFVLHSPQDFRLAPITRQ
jgi:hypothetical protein